MTTTAPAPRTGASRASAFSAAQVVAALPGALRKLDPRRMWRNPVMFVVEVGGALTTVIAIAEPFVGRASSGGSELAPSFSVGIAVGLPCTDNCSSVGLLLENERVELTASCRRFVHVGPWRTDAEGLAVLDGVPVHGIYDHRVPRHAAVPAKGGATVTLRQTDNAA